MAVLASLNMGVNTHVCTLYFYDDGILTIANLSLAIMSQLKTEKLYPFFNIYYRISFNLKLFFAIIKYLKQQCSFG